MEDKILRGVKTEIIIEVYNGDRMVHKVKTSFVGPISFDDEGEKEKH